MSERRENESGASETRESVEFRPKILRSPVKPREKINTRAQAKASTEVEIAKRDLEIETLKEQNEWFRKRIEEIERRQKSECEANSSAENSRADERNSKSFREIRKWLERLETRESGIRPEERNRDATSRDTADSARPTFKVGENTVVNAKLPKGEAPPSNWFEVRELEDIEEAKQSFKAREIRPATVRTIEDFVTLLDDIEYEQKRSRRSFNKGAARTQTRDVSDYHRDNANARASELTKSYDIRRSDFGRDSAGSNVYRPEKSIQDNGRIYKKNTLTVEELPESDSKVKTREIVPFKNSANKIRAKPKATDVDFSSRRKIAAIEGSVEKTESDNEDNINEIAIILTQEILRDIDEITEEVQNRICRKSTPYVSVETATLKCGKNFLVHFSESKVQKITLNAITVEDAQVQMNEILARYAELFKNEVGCKVKEHLLTLESDGIIERASTQYVNPLVVVVKKTGEIRLCLDAREVNKKMLNDHDQPPMIDEVFRRIGDKKYFTTLDVAKAF
ncbi:putative protein tag-278 [Polyergus mexicanus]|uniref:putative protein tag-278 n=1 Tax=Polyergus mexicanus TaxID=615972 RepID=UPI0038B43FD3